MAVPAGKKKCPSDGTEFPERFSHCPQCGAKVEGDSATPDPNADKWLRDIVRSAVSEELEDRDKKRKKAAPKDEWF